MYILTAQQVRAAEGHTIETLGVPATLLMENAGRAVALLAWACLHGGGTGPGGTGGLGGAVGPGGAAGPHWPPLLYRLRPAGPDAAHWFRSAGPDPGHRPHPAGPDPSRLSRPAGPRPRVVAVAGKGNNGGDALAAARHLANWGWEVQVLLWAQPADLPPDARLNLQAVERLGLPVLTSTGAGPEGRQQATELLRSADLILDGLLGTGVRGAPRGSAAEAITLMAQSGRPILAIDLPSGVNTDTGAAPGPAVPATWTLALGTPKPAHFLYPGAGLCGEVWVAEIGIAPQSVAAAAPGAAQLLTRAAAGQILPVPGEDAHKGSRGRLLVVGGSRPMPGAPALAGLAALRAGAGLVYVAVPEPAGDLVAMRGPELITHRIAAGATGGFSPVALTQVLELAAQVQALALGPGLGTDPGAQDLMRELVAGLPVPAVLDADGLRAFTGRPARLRGAGAPLVLTPHPGELAALLDVTTTAVQSDRLGALARAVEVTGQTVVLKGPHTLVGTPDGRVWVNQTGNRALATAGSGDVLTGMIGALLAQGLAPAEAAAGAVAWHGHAGDRLASRLGPDGVLAGDLLPELPPARRELVCGGES